MSELWSNCKICKEKFHAWRRGAKYCSRSCASKSRYGTTYQKKAYSSQSHKRITELHEAFDFDACMIEGCTYSTALDVHRFVAGKDGGKYVVGNMFAICPNHHAEITRKIIGVEKINNKTLRIKSL